MRWKILLVFVVVFLSGCEDQTLEQVQEEILDEVKEDVMEKTKMEEDVMEKPPAKTILSETIVIDTNKYITGGNKNFDAFFFYFTQKTGMGFRVELDADKTITTDIMTDSDCGLLNDDLPYEVIETQQGKDLSFTVEEVFLEDREICIHTVAVDVGDIIVHVLETDLMF